MDVIKSAFTSKSNKVHDDYHPLTDDASIRVPLNNTIYDESMNNMTTNFLDNDEFDQVVHSRREERKLEQESESEFKAKSYEFLKNLGDLFTEFADQKNDIVSFLKYCRYLDNVANNLSKKYLSPSDFRLEITDPFYKEDNFISTLMTLGFEMDISSKGDIILIMAAQPSSRLLTYIKDFLWREYLSKASAVPEIQEERKKIEKQNETQTFTNADPQSGQAKFLASKHEQRINQKYHPSSVNHNSKAVPTTTTEVKKKLPDNWSFQRNTISEDAASISFQNPQGVSYRNMSAQELRTNLDSQLNDYRQRMKNRRPEDIPTYVPSEQDTSSSVFASIKKHIKKAISSDKDQQQQQNAGSKQKGGMMTGAEIEKMRIEEDKVTFGKKALELTNEFRAKNNLRPLIWNQELCDIAMQHSKNMAEGLVPLGHDGFNDRCNQIRFLRWTCCENVAYNANCQSPPAAAVNGWIESPGHRRNMLSDSNACGIACYRNENGQWYFTQFIVFKDESWALKL